MVKVPKTTGIRAIYVALIALIFGAPFSAEAQPAGKTYRVGFLTSYSIPPNATEEHQAGAGYRIFEQTLHDRGYVPGQNVAYRTSQGRSELLPSLATELLGLNVDSTPKKKGRWLQKPHESQPIRERSGTNQRKFPAAWMIADTEDAA